MSDKNVTVSIASPLTLLGVAFVVLRLCGVIDWSWWWVTAPFWGPIAFLLTVVALGAIVGGACRVWNR